MKQLRGKEIKKYFKNNKPKRDFNIVVVLETCFI